MKVRERLLAVKNSSTEEISPINQKDVGRIDTKLNDPSKKRKKLENDLIKQGDKKRSIINFKDKLTSEQQEVVDAIKANNNIFFTG